MNLPYIANTLRELSEKGSVKRISQKRAVVSDDSGVAHVWHLHKEPRTLGFWVQGRRVKQ